MKKPKILVVNDDGIFAKGILSLVEVMTEFGEVTVVAPDKPQSAMGHAISIHNILRINKEEYPVAGVHAYSTSGTPVDCVKLAISEIFKNEPPDLLVSGINHGANSSINVIYSGTMSAALEGALEDIPSIGFSLLSFDHDADFSLAKEVVRQVVPQVLKNKLPLGTCLNVNIPYIDEQEYKGIKICRQAKGYWDEEYIKREDPYGKEYFWTTGEFRLHDKGTDTDEWALKNGFASIVPTQFDLTAHHAIGVINEWDF